MEPRSIGAASLVRLLGPWRDAAMRGPAYRQLADALRLLILDGRVSIGCRLPGEREFSAALGLSRTTTTAAYSVLKADEFIQSSPRSGFHVRLPSGTLKQKSYPTPAPDKDGAIDLARSFLPAAPSVHEAYARALTSLPTYFSTPGYDAGGLDILKDAISRRYAERGLPTTPEQIVVTNGAQHGLSLLLRTLTRPGDDRVLIDHPTYAHAIDAIQRAGCRPIPVSLPDKGWDCDGIAAALRQSSPRMGYLIPDFHNPTGRCMGRAARGAIAAAAAETRTVLVFDETMTDLALDVVVPAPDPIAENNVVRLGSMGKAFWGGLRIGWIRADQDLAAALAAARTSIDLGSPVLEQLAATVLLEDHSDITERRDKLRGQRDALSAMISHHLPGCRFELPSGGLTFWVELPQPISSGLAAIGGRYGLNLAAGPRFGIDGAFERFIRLPFTQSAETLETAMERLAHAYQAVASIGPGGARSSIQLV